MTIYSCFIIFHDSEVIGIGFFKKMGLFEWIFLHVFEVIPTWMIVDSIHIETGLEKEEIYQSKLSKDVPFILGFI